MLLLRLSRGNSTALIPFHGHVVIRRQRRSFHPSIELGAAILPPSFLLVPFPFLSVGRSDSSAVPAAPPPPAAAAMGSSGCWGPGTLPAWRARLWALRLSNPPRRLPACHSQRGGIRGGLDGSWMVDDGFAVRTSLALASSVHCTAGPQQTGLSRPPFPRTPGRRHFAIACSSCRPPPVFFSSFPEELTELWILRV